MAGRTPRRTGKKKVPPRPQTPKTVNGDVGTDTSANTSHVNAPGSDKAIYRDPMVGRRLGKCQIRELIGEGKTAVVYKAIYTPLKRTVAVKVLQEHMTKVPAVVRVFELEGRAVATLDHENVLKIFDVGEEKGKHYLVLELLKGSDLLKVLEQSESGQLPVEEALEHVRQAAAGLAAAHRKKLVHRDIKPQNLVLEPDGTVKIVDFGLAAEAEGAYSGGRIGTPHYMAPEQCRGENAVTASDIYALGITLFHLMVGHPPFAGLHSTEEIVDEHLKGHRFEPEKIVKGIPRRVGDLVRQMTRQDPRARPTAREVLETIGKLTPERLAEGPRRRVGKASRRGGRRSTESSPPMGLLIGVGVIVVVAVLFLLTRGGDGPKSVKPVVPPPEEAAAQAPPEEMKRKPSAPQLKGELKDEIKQLLADAKQEERTGNIEEAYRLFMRVVAKAPAGSAESGEATAAASALKEAFTRKARDVGLGRKKRPAYVSVEQSEEAGRELAERKEELDGWIRTFRLLKARSLLDDLRLRTREGSPERIAVEVYLHRLEFMDRLLAMVEGRAQALPADRAQWVNYDVMASGDLVVIGAAARGIEIRDESISANETRSWERIGSRMMIDFIEGLRNKSSGYEALWMGYLCRLWGDDRASRYFEFAKMLDKSPEMKGEVAALEEG